MDPAVFAAAIDEAHRQHLRVASHIFYLDDAKALIAHGVDALAHSIRDRDVDAELISTMKQRGTFYVATLNVDESSFAFLDEPALLDNRFFQNALSPAALEQLKSPEYRNKVTNDPNTPKNRAALATGMRNLKKLHDAGVRIAFGTDSGGNPVRIPGWGEHRELELMVKAGLTPMQALVAATRGSAAMLGAADRGTLAKGQRADFVVLAADPLEDIRNTRQIVSIWSGGREVKPRTQLATAQ
jgi:imidazolonepropionase-like amidohydrolase